MEKSEADEIREAYLNMPDDVADAFEAMKLAIARLECSGWDNFSRLDVLSILGLLAAIATTDPSPASNKPGGE